MPDSLRNILDVERLQKLVGAVLVVASDLDLNQVLRKIVESAMELVSARYGALSVLSEEGGIEQFIAVGMSEEEVEAIGTPPIGRGVLSLLDLDKGPVRIDDVTKHPKYIGYPDSHPIMHSFLGVPVNVRDEQFGRLYLTDKIDGDTFTSEDEDIVVALSHAAAIVVDKALLHTRLSTLTLLEERERIARDLHDTVIQRLFGTGLMLNSIERLEMSPEARERVEQVISELDEIIRQIRTTIFHLSHPDHEDMALNRYLNKVVDDFTSHSGIDAKLSINGSLERVEGTPVAENLVFSLNEALSNVIRHAKATSVRVDIRCNGMLLMKVIDNGIGIDDDESRYKGMGLRNLADRARILGGKFYVRVREEGGTELVWTANTNR